MCNITGGHVVATPAVNDIELGSLTTIHNTALYDAQFPVVFGYINNTVSMCVLVYVRVVL